MSPAEARLALAVGFPPERILFTVNNMTTAEMHEVASLGRRSSSGGGSSTGSSSSSSSSGNDGSNGGSNGGQVGGGGGGGEGGGDADAAAADDDDDDDGTGDGADAIVLFNLGSLSELRKYGAAYPGSRVCVRVNPHVEAGEHAIVKTGTETCKFDVPLSDMGEVR